MYQEFDGEFYLKEEAILNIIG